MTTSVVAIYQFKSISDVGALREDLYHFCHRQNVLGTLLLAEEGINGTISGLREQLELVVSFLETKGFTQLELKYSHADDSPFLRLKVVRKQEIVTLGQDVDPCVIVGEYVDVQDWNALITQEDVLVIDTRNHYEYELGTFKGAVNPNTENFREFPDYVASLDPKRYPKVAMFCTGGIRCEKASSYMLAAGFEELYHLHGGVLKYLELIDPAESLWEGECFVFDRRVALGHGLSLSGYIQCFACRRALKPHELEDPHYHEGVSCQHCYADLSIEVRQRLMERQKQIVLAKARGVSHIGEYIGPKA